MIRTARIAIGIAIAAIAATLPAVNPATALVSGHFTTDAPSTGTILDITGGNSLVLQVGGEEIKCHESKYTAQLQSTTVQQVTVEATHEGCTASWFGLTTNATVVMNGCRYLVRSRSSGGHATVELTCPIASTVEIQGIFCNLRLTIQKPESGVTYTTVIAHEKHALTVNLTAKGLWVERHGPSCGTPTLLKTGQLTGSLLVHGTDKNTGNAVNVTAT